MNNNFSSRLQKIEEALHNAILLDFNSEWQTESFGKLPESVKPQFIQNLIEPNLHLINLGGKRWRPLLLILCYEMAKKTKPG